MSACSPARGARELCKTCGAAIEWVLTRKGKRMPLDVAPTLYGEFVVVIENGQLIARKRTPDDLGAARTSHFATCPQAAQHRRR